MAAGHNLATEIAMPNAAGTEIADTVWKSDKDELTRQLALAQAEVNAWVWWLCTARIDDPAGCLC